MFQLELLPLEDHHSQQCNKKWKGQVKKKMTRRNGKRSITADVMEEKSERWHWSTFSCQGMNSSFPSKGRANEGRPGAWWAVEDWETDGRASTPRAAADPRSAAPSAVQPQPADALPCVPHHEGHAGHQVQGAHNCVQLCQQAWGKKKKTKTGFKAQRWLITCKFLLTMNYF